jgi:hypothetical protein
MASKPNSSNPEQGPERELEDAARFEANLEYVKRSSGAWVERLMTDLDLPEEDVFQLAVVVFGRYIDLTNAPDKLVLVVQGEVTAYDNALQALLVDEREQDFYGALIGRLREENPGTEK